MDQDPVLLRVVGDVTTITLNRLDAGNAINLPLARALLQAAIQCQANDSIRCVLLTGAGKLFCAGGDVRAFEKAGDGVPSLLRELASTVHMAMTKFAHMLKPLVT